MKNIFLVIFFANFIPRTAEIRQVKKFNYFQLKPNSRKSQLLPTWNCSHLCKYCTNLGVSIHVNTGTHVQLTNTSIAKMLKTESLILSPLWNKCKTLFLALRNDSILTTTYRHTEQINIGENARYLGTSVINTNLTKDM